jgi:acetyl esterase/lipase
MTGGADAASGTNGGAAGVAGSAGSSATAGHGGAAGQSGAAGDGATGGTGVSGSGGSGGLAGQSGGGGTAGRADGGADGTPAGGGGTAGQTTGGGTGGRGGAAGAGTGGRGGAAGAATGGTAAGAGGGGHLQPPVRDTASKVPISSAPGYVVEGNYPYGPLTAQRLDVIYPSGAGPKGTKVLPAVLMFHGGAWIHSYTNNYGSGKDHMSTFFDRFLAHGFIVFNAEYRVNDGTADGAPAPAAVQDALDAAKWCWDYMDYFQGDRSQFVVTGASAGGHLALMVGMTTPAAMLGPTTPGDFRIAGIVSGYGPADIEAELDGVAKDWIPTTLPDRLAIAKLVNPQTYVSKDVPPLIVVQGALDTTAPVADSHRLVDRLVAAGADASMHEVPGAGHGFQTPATAWPDAEKAMFDWLVAHGIGK